MKNKSDNDLDKLNEFFEEKNLLDQREIILKEIICRSLIKIEDLNNNE